MLLFEAFLTPSPMLYTYASDTVIHSGFMPGLLSNHMLGLMMSGVSDFTEGRLCHDARCVDILSCWKTSTSPAMLQIAPIRGPLIHIH